MSQTEKALCISLIGDEARTGIQQEVRPLIELAWPQRLNHKQRVALANAYIAIMVASITYFSIHPADAKEYFLLEFAQITTSSSFSPHWMMRAG